eukprot:963145-Pyramimonas_sp.AAC.1
MSTAPRGSPARARPAPPSHRSQATSRTPSAPPRGPRRSLGSDWHKGRGARRVSAQTRAPARVEPALDGPMG